MSSLKILLLATFVLITTTQECPESVNVTIKQAEKLSNLDDEAVELICVISGVTREEIEYYWWLIDATYTPIYTFSDKHTIERMAPDYRRFVLDVHHKMVNRKQFMSTIRLKVGELQNETLLCELVLINFSVCSDKARINLEEGTALGAKHLHPVSFTDSNDMNSTGPMAYGASTYGQTTGAAKGLRFLKLFSPQNDPFANNLIVHAVVTLFLVVIIIIASVVGTCMGSYVVIRKINEVSVRRESRGDEENLL